MNSILVKVAVVLLSKAGYLVVPTFAEHLLGLETLRKLGIKIAVIDDC